jgi:hypothetical protein
VCRNRYVDPRSGGTEGVGDAWTCAACAEGAAPPDEAVEMSLEAWVELSGGRLLPAGFWKASSLWAAAALFDAGAEPTVAPTVAPTSLRLRGKEVKNAVELDAKVVACVADARAERGTCVLCFGDDFPKANLHPVCGRSGCAQLACGGCLGRWYGETRPGRVVAETHMQCPFCKKRPAPRVLRRHNVAMCAMKLPAHVLDPAFVHAWCLDCYRVRPAFARACGPAQQATLVDFRCEDCGPPSPADGPTGDYKPCPGCTVMTQKASGCDHIECTACRAHWCYACGALSSADAIYAHMMAEHGSYGIADGYDDDGYGDRDDDDGWNSE